jgi:DsbC/DsbD-like thiol-disulfide interchange protein
VLKLWEEGYTTIRAGAATQIVLRASIAEGYAVVARDKRGKLLPLALKMERAVHLKLGNPVFPEPQTIKLAGESAEVQAYRGTIVITLPVTAPANIDPEPQELKGLLQYQACDSHRCGPAQAIPVEINVRIRRKPAD